MDGRTAYVALEQDMGLTLARVDLGDLRVVDSEVVPGVGLQASVTAMTMDPVLQVLRRTPHTAPGRHDEGTLARRARAGQSFITLWCGPSSWG